MTIALYDSLDSLAQGIEDMGGLSPEYWAKQIHKIPDAPSVERVTWLLNRLAGKTVLHIGCAGPLHEALLKTCKRVYGIDHVEARYPDYCQMDIEAEELPSYEGVEVVLLAEILEHVTSIGVLMWQLRTHYPASETIITTPNAYSSARQIWLNKGYQNVNIDHTAFFSWRTLKTLLDKCSYEQKEFYWYNGPPRIAEGMIVVAIPR